MTTLNSNGLFQENRLALLESKNLQDTLKKLEIAEEDMTKLKRENAQQMNDWKREKAIFEQRIELLNKQVAEGKIREDNLRNMNENIMSALTDLTNDKKFYLQCDNCEIFEKGAKELREALEQHTREMMEQKNKNSEIIKTLEAENGELKRKISDLESNVTKTELDLGRKILENKENHEKYEKDRQLLQKAINSLETEKKISMAQREHEREALNRERASILRKMEEDLKAETEKVRREAEIMINKMKYGVEEEKQNNQRELLELKITIKKIEGEMSEPFENMIEYVKGKKNEISRLNKNIELMKKTQITDMVALKNQKEEALKRVEFLEDSLKKMKNGMKNTQNLNENKTKAMKEKLDKAKEVLDLYETLKEENKTQKLKILELNMQKRQQVKKLETIERRQKDHISALKQDVNKNQDRDKLEICLGAETPTKNDLSLTPAKSTSKGELTYSNNRTKDQSNTPGLVISKKEKKETNRRYCENLDTDLYNTNDSETTEKANLFKSSENADHRPKSLKLQLTPQGDQAKSKKSLVQNKTSANLSQLPLNPVMTEGIFQFCSQTNEGSLNLSSTPGGGYRNQEIESKTPKIDSKSNINCPNNGIFCEICKSSLKPNDFLSHYLCCQSVKDSKEQPQSKVGRSEGHNSCKSIFYDQEFRFDTNEKYNSREEDLAYQLQEANEMKNLLISQNKTLKEELEKVVFELKQTKMEAAINEEKKEETEIALKTEIKYLVAQVFKDKEGTKQQFSSHNLSLNSSIANGTSFLPSNSYKTLQRTKSGLKNILLEQQPSLNSSNNQQNFSKRDSHKQNDQKNLLNMTSPDFYDNYLGKENWDPKKTERILYDLDCNDDAFTEHKKPSESIQQNINNSMHYIKKSMKNLRK